MKYSIEELKELVGLARLTGAIKKAEEKEKNLLVIVLAIIGVLAVIGGIAYAIWRIRERRMEDYDLYDDLDYYFDDDEFDIPEDDEEADVEVAPATEK